MVFLKGGMLFQQRSWPFIRYHDFSLKQLIHFDFSLKLNGLWRITMLFPRIMFLFIRIMLLEYKIRIWVGNHDVFWGKNNGVWWNAHDFSWKSWFLYKIHNKKHMTSLNLFSRIVDTVDGNNPAPPWSIGIGWTWWSTFQKTMGIYSTW